MIANTHICFQGYFHTEYFKKIDVLFSLDLYVERHVTSIKERRGLFLYKFKHECFYETRRASIFPLQKTQK